MHALHLSDFLRLLAWLGLWLGLLCWFGGMLQTRLNGGVDAPQRYRVSPLLCALGALGLTPIFWLEHVPALSMGPATSFVLAALLIGATTTVSMLWLRHSRPGQEPWLALGASWLLALMLLNMVLPIALAALALTMAIGLMMVILAWDDSAQAEHLQTVNATLVLPVVTLPLAGQLASQVPQSMGWLAVVLLCLAAVLVDRYLIWRKTGTYPDMQFTLLPAAAMCSTLALVILNAR